MGNPKSRVFTKRRNAHCRRLRYLYETTNAKFQSDSNQYTQKMVDYLGIELKDESFPGVKICEEQEGEINRDDPPCYLHNLNCISLPKKEINSGDAWGEEIGHFLRAQTAPKSQQYEDEISVAEFFGYLGRRILKKITPPESNLIFEPIEKYTNLANLVTKIKTFQQTKKRHEQIALEMEKPQSRLRVLVSRLIWWMMDGSPESRQEWIDLNKAVAQEAKENKQSAINHYRGYYMATQIDLDKVNFQELYSLSQEEVTRRFFGKEKIYNLPEKTLEQKVMTQQI